jgi:hypothetical protein
MVYTPGSAAGGISMPPFGDRPRPAVKNLS